MIDEFEAGRVKIGVLYLDNHLLAIVKPANMPVQKDMSGDTDVLTACKNYIGEKFQKPGNVYLGLVHRLDRPVGGAMVLARTSKAAARLSAAFSSHTAKKRYLCVVRGALDRPMELTDYLLKNEYTGTSAVVDENTAGAKLAILRTAPIAFREGLTLCDVELLTGRSHQIRVQHAHAGFPLWGDARYGDGLPGQQIALWAHKLTIEHPTLKTELTFTAPPPESGAWRNFIEELS